MTRVVTSRFGISYPNATLRDEPADVPGDLKIIAENVDANAAMYSQGAFSSRPAFGKQGRIYLATDTNRVSYDTGTAWIEDVTGALWLSDTQYDALSTGLFDGLRVAVHFAAGNFIWDLVYDISGSPFKFRCAGGAFHDAETNVSETTTSLTYVDLATVGPSITIPFDGIYDIEFGCLATSPAANQGARCAPKFGAAATSDNDRVEIQSSGDSVVVSLSRVIKAKTLSKNDVVKLQYRAVTGGTATFDKRWLIVRPVLVAN